MVTKNEKRRIILSKEQEEKHAAMSAQKAQAFVGELNMIQARRYETALTLLGAQVTHAGVASTTIEDVAKCRTLADELIRADAVQKWTGLKTLAAAVGIEGPQPHLEWAARQVGVQLFEDSSPILAPDVEVSEGRSIQ